MRNRGLLFLLGVMALIATVGGFVWAHAGNFPDSLEPQRWIRWAVAFAHSSQWSFLVFVALIALLSQVFVPINLLLLSAALAFPGWQGFFIGMGGAVMAALMQAELGRVIGKEALTRGFGQRFGRRFGRRFSERFDIVSNEIAANGFSAMLVMSLVPIAPAFVTNTVAGVCRVPRWKHVAGTMIGFLPGLAIMNLLSQKMRAFVSDPSLKAGIWFVGLIALFLLAGSIARRCKQRLDARLRSRRPQGCVESEIAAGTSVCTEI